MKINDGGPAFPGEQGHIPDGTWNQTWCEGMSLLEYYAGKALPQCIEMVKATVRSQVEAEKAATFAAGAAFDIAAAMVAESQKRKGGVA